MLFKVAFHNNLIINTLVSQKNLHDIHVLTNLLMKNQDGL